MAEGLYYNYTIPNPNSIPTTFNGLNLDYAKVEPLNESQVITDAFSDEGDVDIVTARQIKAVVLP
jgi:hypothetical protein